VRALAVRATACRTGWSHVPGDLFVVRPATTTVGGALQAAGGIDPSTELWEVVLPLEEAGDVMPKCDCEAVRAVTAEELARGDEFFYDGLGGRR
jgi:hypothetical protein